MKRRMEAKAQAIALSRPARGAWIETLAYIFHEGQVHVAPRAGRVD